MIHVLGEALMDIIIDQYGEVSSVVGGGPLNTARTIARLGERVSFIGGISNDSFGQRILREIESDGVLIGITECMSEPSTVALASLDASGAATYRFHMDQTAAASVTTEQALQAFDVAARALHVGTLALVLTPLAHAARSVIDAMSQSQILMLDPNVRPAVMTDSQTFIGTLEHALRRVDLLKVSADDLSYLYPEINPLESARLLHRSNSATVLFTDGSNSVRIFVQGSERALEVPEVSVVDTVGAGDSFSGAFLAFWAKKDWVRIDCQDVDRVEEAARFGIKVAGITCQSSGAQPPFAHDLGPNMLRLG